MPTWGVRDEDREFFAHELESFVPNRVYDMGCHLSLPGPLPERSGALQCLDQRTDREGPARAAHSRDDRHNRVQDDAEMAELKDFFMQKGLL